MLTQLRQINLNVYLGTAAIVGIGMLGTAGLLTADYAREAIAFLLGAGAVAGVNVARRGGDGGA